MLSSGETARKRADSPESVLFEKTSILPLALKELTVGLTVVSNAKLYVWPSDVYLLKGDTTRKP